VGQGIRFYPNVPSGFNGSAVIESTEPIAVVVTEVGNDPQYNAAYEGFETASDVVRLPLLMSDNGGFYTFFNVQHAGAPGSTTVTVDFIEEPGKGYASIPDDTCTIDAGESCTFSQEHGIGAPWTARWVGSAEITTDDGTPVVATVNQVHKPGTGGLASYSGFVGAGSTTVVLPTVMNANAGFWCGINVLNAGDATTDITLRFYPEPGQGYPAIANITLEDVAVNELGVQLTVTIPELAGDVKWVGSVEVDGNGQEVFAIVNTLQAAAQSQFLAVKGLPADPLTTPATDAVYMPAIMSFSSIPGWWTGAQIYNTEANTTTVTVEYSTCEVSMGCNPAWTPASEVKDVGPGKIMVWNQAGGGTQWDGKYYFGAATATTDDGAKILGLVNMIGAGWEASGDVTNGYNAINQ
jgi:hypothetical protein